VTPRNDSADETGRATDEAAWESLSSEIRVCTRCRLHATRTQAVIYRGSLRPRVLFVGEAPGAAEDREGLPFVGRSGKKLDVAIATIGLGSDQFGVLNLVKCRPPENVFDPVAERTCRPYLDRQVAILKPEVLVTLGAHALRAVAPHALPILTSAGSPIAGTRPPVFPLIHPAAAMRSSRLTERWNRDVAGLGAWLRMSLQHPF
jgi:uracil-DNA glycosylase family 4